MGKGVTSPLRSMRERHAIAREDLVRVSKVSLGTVRNAEIGKKISMRSAHQILKALNHWLCQKEQPQVNMDDLGIVL